MGLNVKETLRYAPRPEGPGAVWVLLPPQAVTAQQVQDVRRADETPLYLRAAIQRRGRRRVNAL